MQEVGQPLGVYLIVPDRLKVELGAVALMLKLRYALLRARGDYALFDGVQDVLQAALGGRERLGGLLAPRRHLCPVRAFRHHAGYPQGLLAVLQKSPQRLDDLALKLLAPDGLNASVVAAVVLVLAVAAPAPAHALQVAPAARADRLARKGEVAPALRAALLGRAYALCLHERHLVDDRGHAALFDNAAPLVAPRVLPVLHHPLDHRVAARVSLRGLDPACREVASYRVGGLLCYAPLERLAHESGLVLVDHVLVGLVAGVAEHAHAVGLALERVALHAAPRADRGLLRLACRKALKQLLVNDALGRIWYLFKRRDELHAVLGKLALVYGRVVLPTAEAIHHVHKHYVALTRVGYHALELGAVIGAPAYGVVAVFRHDGVPLALAPLAADAQLIIY